MTRLQIFSGVLAGWLLMLGMLSNGATTASAQQDGDPLAPTDDTWLELTAIPTLPALKACRCSNGPEDDLPQLFLLPTATAIPDNSIAQTDDAVVRAVMFWMDGCPHCHDVIDNILPALKQRFGDQFEILLIEVITSGDVEALYQLAAQFDIPRNQAGVPFLIIGDKVLVGSDQISSGLSEWIEIYIAEGGIDYPDVSGLDNGQLFTLTDCVAGTPCLGEFSEIAASPATSQPKPDGYMLAMMIAFGMIGALIYVVGVLICAVRNCPLPQPPEWLGQATPILALIGLGVAGYLSYIEIQAVPAVCGPVGDCNTVQSSSYAKLFGAVPIGLIGVMGYIAILFSWIWDYLKPSQSTASTKAIFIMALFGVVFSLYLTYLELFVIEAVCIWCLASAVIITLLMLSNTTLPVKRLNQHE